MPEGVESTLDLMKPEGMQALVAAGRFLAGRGARMLVLACTGMSTIGAAGILREKPAFPSSIP